MDRYLIERMKEIYTKTTCKVKVNCKILSEFETRKEIRQGCPISPTIFNAVFSDLETEMCKEQEGGLVRGRKKLWTLSYADDVALMAKRRFKKYLEKKGLELNVDKTKIMICRQLGGRKKN